MNPENMGDHVSQRHSYLWRKSMFVNNDGDNNINCHKQLNDGTYLMTQLAIQASAGPQETTKLQLIYQESRTNLPAL
jgi:hypothetical protein